MHNNGLWLITGIDNEQDLKLFLTKIYYVGCYHMDTAH